MYAEDLRPYDYKLPYLLENVFMVGWIDSAHHFATGNPDDALIRKLHSIIETRSRTTDLHVNAVRGIHPCNVCEKEIHEVGAKGEQFFLGMSEIWIPQGRVWFAAPSLIVHYMEEHRYVPVQEFQLAVTGFDLEQEVVSQNAFDVAVRKMVKIASVDPLR